MAAKTFFDKVKEIVKGRGDAVQKLSDLDNLLLARDKARVDAELKKLSKRASGTVAEVAGELAGRLESSAAEGADAE